VTQQKTTNSINGKLVCYLAISACICFGVGGCVSDAHEIDLVDKDTGTSEPQDTGSPDTGDGDTGEPEEKPPELPEVCELVLVREAGVDVSQQELAGDGDGSFPDIQFNDGFSNALAAWAYYDFTTDEQWEIQTASYTVTASEVDGETVYERRVDDYVYPTSSGPVARDPALVAGDGEYGMVWRDGRWDPECDRAAPLECALELAFTTLDEDGNVIGDATDPIQLTSGADLKYRPSIASIPGGYLVTWTETRDAEHVLMGARIDSSGNILDSQILSDSDEVDRPSGGPVAANEELAVVVWAPLQKNKIVARVWRHSDPAPSEEVFVISDEGGELLRPKITAGDEGFMVIWSARIDVDMELYVRPLHSDGEPVSTAQRATWTPGAILSADVAYGLDSFAVAWTSHTANGAEECAISSSCPDQVFAAPIDEDGALSGQPVMLSNDKNRCANVELSWDGLGWTAVWESNRTVVSGTVQRRWQLFYGQMVCP
jgi:hypothetical protein